MERKNSFADLRQGYHRILPHVRQSARNFKGPGHGSIPILKTASRFPRKFLGITFHSDRSGKLFPPRKSLFNLFWWIHHQFSLDAAVSLIAEYPFRGPKDSKEIVGRTEGERKPLQVGGGKYFGCRGSPGS